MRHSRILLGAWAGMALAAVLADSARIATDWVKINRRLGGERWNPFKALVDQARAMRTARALAPVKALPGACAGDGA